MSGHATSASATCSLSSVINIPRACPDEYVVSSQNRLNHCIIVIVYYYFTVTGKIIVAVVANASSRFRPVHHVRPERFQPSPTVVRARPRVVGRRRQVADDQTTGQRSRAFLFGQGMIDHNVYNNGFVIAFLTIGYTLNTFCRRTYGTSSKSSPRT